MSRSSPPPPRPLLAACYRAGLVTRCSAVARPRCSAAVLRPHLGKDLLVPWASESQPGLPTHTSASSTSLQGLQKAEFIPLHGRTRLTCHGWARRATAAPHQQGDARLSCPVPLHLCSLPLPERLEGGREAGRHGLDAMGWTPRAGCHALSSAGLSQSDHNTLAAFSPGPGSLALRGGPSTPASARL